MKSIVAISIFLGAFGLAACDTAATPPSYGQVGGPLVAPTNANAAATSGSTVNQQGTSGYYAYPGCPDVNPTTNAADASTTASKQATSGYYPSAGCPDTPVSPSKR